jgi:hypothetical protein
VELAAASTPFLEDGDLLVMRGWCQGDGYRVEDDWRVSCHCERRSIHGAAERFRRYQ